MTPAPSPTDKVDLIFRNLTREQALTFAAWYEGQGEQDQTEWFDMHSIRHPMTDVSRKGGYLEDTPEAVIVHLYTI